MKQSLQLRLGQQLTMTPQLQQAIRLLQLSTVELQIEIQQALESNPMLEALEDGEDEGSGADGPEAAADPVGEVSVEEPATLAAADESASEALAELPQSDAQEQAIPEELPVDSAWEDVYDNAWLPAAGGADGEEREGLEPRGTATESLREHLLWQLNLTPFSETDTAIALAIIDAIDDDGYLSVPLEEIHQGLAPELQVELAEVEAVLHRIQRFDPVGVGARDLRECLLVQLAQLPEDTPWREEAMRLVGEHLELLAAHDYTQLRRRLRLDEQALRAVVGLIRTLNPRPGSALPGPEPEYVIPDVFVRKQRGVWRVELNPEALPRLRINPQYAALVRRADSSEENAYLRSHLQEARWFLKSLQSRNETLLKVATCIVERQRAFLEYGEEAMKPMVLRDVAEAVGMHESTISRVTTQKYMHTPRGIYEFKYFFSSHVGTTDGGECSATAIRAMIRKLIAAEDPRKPLSDSKIAQILHEREGINVARRTVAKYREAMAIPPSNERRRLV